jgi:hypothetical protein
VAIQALSQTSKMGKLTYSAGKRTQITCPENTEPHSDWTRCVVT